MAEDDLGTTVLKCVCVCECVCFLCCPRNSQGILFEEVDIHRTFRLVQVRCMSTSTPRYFCALTLMASVRSLVLPPAPQVTSTNSGSSFAILSMRADLGFAGVGREWNKMGWDGMAGSVGGERAGRSGAYY